MKRFACAGVVAAMTGFALVSGSGAASAAPGGEVGGDGSYYVSDDQWDQMLPGTYSTDGPYGGNACHWTISAADGHIRSQNQTSGRATVSVDAGETFTTRNCRPWILDYDPLQTIGPIAIGIAAVGSSAGSVLLPGIVGLMLYQGDGEE